MVQSIDKIHEPLEATSIDIELFQLLSTMPEALKVEILHYAGYLLQKKSEVGIQDIEHDSESAEQEVVKKKIEKKYGYGSLAGKITMSDDFDEPLEDLKEYM